MLKVNTSKCNYASNYHFTFLLLQKSNKKRAPKSITSRFREGSLIEHLYYCKPELSSLN